MPKPSLRLVKNQPDPEPLAARILIKQFKGLPVEPNCPSPAEIMQVMPEMLTEILEVLLHNYDYIDNIKEPPAVCFRMLAGVIAAIEDIQADNQQPMIKGGLS